MLRMRSTRASTRSCSRGKPPPALTRSKRCRHSPRSSAMPNRCHRRNGSRQPSSRPAALTLASAREADAIVAVTREGKTARLLSALRPRAPIFAATASIRLAGTLALYWGVVPVITEEREVGRLERLLLDRNILQPGSVVVFVNVSADVSQLDANFVNVQRIG